MDQEAKGGGFSGSIFEWISLLKQITNLASELDRKSQFINVVKKYLLEEPENLSDTSENDI